MSPGVVGVLTNTSGVAPATGGFAVNAQGTPDATVAVSAGVATVTATPTSGNSQLLRVKNSATSNVTISANSTGGTRYDWIYVKIDPDKAKDPASDASDVATLVSSRSTSATTDNGTPPTYGTLIAVVTVANGFSTITNGNIADKRVRAVAVGGLNDTNGNEAVKVSATASAVNEITVTNAATGNAPTISATGDDTNIDLNISGKGTGRVKIDGAGLGDSAIVATSQTTTSTSYTDLSTTGPAVTVTVGNSGCLLVSVYSRCTNNTSNAFSKMGFALSSANTQAAADNFAFSFQSNPANSVSRMSGVFLVTGLTPGSTVVTAKYAAETGGSGAGTATFSDRRITAIPV